ncbi:MAG TPA: hypothetical protein PKE30_14945, partial [Niabella sp.]|nr:hypothetical protein [Niabella sp.]
GGFLTAYKIIFLTQFFQGHSLQFIAINSSIQRHNIIDFARPTSGRAPQIDNSTRPRHLFQAHFLKV